MAPALTILFVCEHGAAKSVLAATYFDQLASQMGLALRASARGTNPEPELSPQVIWGLAEDGLTPNEPLPRQLTELDLQAAQRVISFCELPVNFLTSTIVEYWSDVPPVSENYELARDVIVDHIRQLLKSLG